MSDFEIATHVQCSEPDLAHLLTVYQQILNDLGVPNALSADSLAGITWASDGSGFVHWGTPLQLRRLHLNSEAVTARPYVLGYTSYSIPGTTSAWVQLGLTFEGDWELPSEGTSGVRWQYVAGIGRIVWRVVQAYVSHLPDSWVYFDGAALVNEPWYALLGMDGDLWAFDLASVPASLESLYSPVPDGYARKSMGNRINFARTVCWQVVPWDE